MEKPAIHSKYINSRVTSFFDVLRKANHRPYCADEVILKRSDDLLQPTIGWSSYTRKGAVQQKLSDGTINTPSKTVHCWRSQNWHIMFQFKWCICMLRLHRNILTILKKIGYQFVRGSRWWKTLVLSSSATLNEHSWCSQKIGVVVRYIGKPFCT